MKKQYATRLNEATIKQIKEISECHDKPASIIIEEAIKLYYTTKCHDTKQDCHDTKQDCHDTKQDKTNLPFEEWYKTYTGPPQYARTAYDAYNNNKTV